MKKREVSIINFLNLNKEEYEKILEYRNQEFVRRFSKNSDIITKEDHAKYHKLLEKKDEYFAFLIKVDGKDYGVISLKKQDDDTYYTGDYLVKEDYKFEGGGIVNTICLNYICKNLGIKYLFYEILRANTRVFRLGINKIHSQQDNGDSFYETVEVVPLEDNSNSKIKKIFDKIYEITNYVY